MGAGVCLLINLFALNVKYPIVIFTTPHSPLGLAALEEKNQNIFNYHRDSLYIRTPAAPYTLGQITCICRQKSFFDHQTSFCNYTRLKPLFILICTKNGRYAAEICGISASSSQLLHVCHSFGHWWLGYE